MLARDVVTRDDFLALLDVITGGRWPLDNYRTQRYVDVLAAAIAGRQVSSDPEQPKPYEECSWRQFAEILASASSRD